MFNINTKDDVKIISSNSRRIINTLNNYNNRVDINFPKISIYDEYEYIKLLLSDIADIYNLPIIPPIKII